jgi:hypothetical protein
MSLTTPSVNFPDCWSDFKTIETLDPGLISARFVPLTLLFHPPTPSYHNGGLQQDKKKRCGTPPASAGAVSHLFFCTNLKEALKQAVSDYVI